MPMNRTPIEYTLDEGFQGEIEVVVIPIAVIYWATVTIEGHLTPTLRGFTQYAS